MTTKSDLSVTPKDAQQECPIFLRKTYHMVDTCDSKIACWSEDGETFIVKNTRVFEQTIIPQFFKHSKFSSFVRQLNFYGFRKIKYADTLRIDAKLEAETCNFWRFKHDKFRRGKPEWLVEIKRSNGQQQQQAVAAPVVTPSHSSSTATDVQLKSEVSSLKKRIELMSKNIDDLTSLVQKVSLKQEDHDDTASVALGHKRKKLLQESDLRPDMTISSDDSCPVEIQQEFPLLPPSVFPTTETLPRRESLSSVSTTTADETDFVDQLFSAFENEDDLLMEDTETDALMESPTKKDAPDPALMKSLSDALALLPREMQELIVNRLIATITGTDFLEKHAAAEPEVPAKQQEQQQPFPSPVPLAAAATLAAILAQYCGTDNKSKQMIHKALVPAIPIHA